jgi:hypothetical protein
LVTFFIAGSNISTPIATGELIDKITILEIKAERITDPQKLINVRRELNELYHTRDQYIPASPELTELTNQLRHINTILWEIEDIIREYEFKRNFNARFIAFARGVYFTNDLRCAIKRLINQLTNSLITEEKSYKDYIA